MGCDAGTGTNGPGQALVAGKLAPAVQELYPDQAT
jgi:hypothetical protein